MDREEAVAVLEAIKQFGIGKWIFDKEEIEAFDMAIEALSAETPTDQQKHQLSEETPTNVPTDLISRADAIKAIESRQTEQWIDADVDYNNGLESAVAEIKALPSADRPTELLKDGTLKVNVQNGADVKRVLVLGDDYFGGLYYADDRPSGEWVEKEVMVDEDTNITEWQSAKCSDCGKYHTTPYMYYFEEYKYCPNCGAKMGGK